MPRHTIQHKQQQQQQQRSSQAVIAAADAVARRISKQLSALTRDAANLAQQVCFQRLLCEADNCATASTVTVIFTFMCFLCGRCLWPLLSHCCSERATAHSASGNAAGIASEMMTWHHRHHCSHHCTCSAQTLQQCSPHAYVITAPLQVATGAATGGITAAATTAHHCVISSSTGTSTATLKMTTSAHNAELVK
eukprot:7019-Heterococcus_DN1.PRE.2